ncbi:MAG: tail fiber protein, partial [Bacteroidota bacterium]
TIGGSLTFNNNGTNTSLTLPTDRGTNGQVLTSDGNGNATWQDASASGATNEIADADNDTKIQVEENPDEDVIRFDVAGTEVLSMSRTANNLTIIEVPNNESNLFIGAEAGQNVSASNGRNTFIGNRAGRSNTTGGTNVYIGDGAASNNSTGSSNVIIGRAAGAGNFGSSNVLVGKQAAFENRLGSDITAIGSLSGQGSSGSGHVFIGNRSGSFATGDNKLYIENTISNSPLIYGEFDNDLVRINGDLQVTGTVPVPIEVADADNDTRIQVEEAADEDKIRFDVAGREILVLETNQLTFQAIGATADPVGMDFITHDGAVNSIRYSNQLEINPSADSYTMDFHVSGNQTLRLAGDGRVEINEEYKLPRADGNAGDVLTTNGNGNVSWSPVIGTPIGSVTMYAGATAPDGWLICDGSTFSASTYPALQAVLGGTTLPDMRGRFPLGVGNSNTTYASDHNLGDTGGFEQHQLSMAEMPRHAHDAGTLRTQFAYKTRSNTGNQNNKDGSDENFYDSDGITGDTGFQGEDAPHNNMPPFLTMNFIIKAR